MEALSSVKKTWSSISHTEALIIRSSVFPVQSLCAKTWVPSSILHKLYKLHETKNNSTHSCSQFLCGQPVLCRRILWQIRFEYLQDISCCNSTYGPWTNPVGMGLVGSGRRPNAAFMDDSKFEGVGVGFAAESSSVPSSVSCGSHDD